MQLTEERAMLHEGIPAGLCLECAVRRHDFKEILGQGRCDDHFYEAPLAARVIGG